MLNWLKKRFSEGSTYAGLAVATLGAGEAFKFTEAPEIAATVQAAGEQAVAGNPWGAALVAGLGLAAIFTRDKGDKG